MEDFSASTVPYVSFISKQLLSGQPKRSSTFPLLSICSRSVRTEKVPVYIFRKDLQVLSGARAELLYMQTSDKVRMTPTTKKEGGGGGRDARFINTSYKTPLVIASYCAAQRKNQVLLHSLLSNFTPPKLSPAITNLIKKTIFWQIRSKYRCLLNMINLNPILLSLKLLFNKKICYRSITHIPHCNTAI